MIKLTDNFTLDELTARNTAERMDIDNKPHPKDLENLKQTAKMLEQIRTLCGDYPLIVSSGYRSPILNSAVGGSKKSFHCRGKAADFTIRQFGSPYDVCKKIINSGIQFDLIIQEYGRWIHIQWNTKPRRKILTKCTNKPYTTGLKRCIIP